MSAEDIDHQASAVSLLKEALGGEGIGLFTTADETGQPHATWMATFAFVDRDRIITLTSPDSLKVANIMQNPKVEWLFTSTDFTQLVYLKGTARVENDPAEFKRHWQCLPDKNRAYFLDKPNSSPGFATIRTEVDQILYVLPKESKSFEIPTDGILNGLAADH